QRDYFRRQVRLWVPGEARPKFENRVDVSPTVRDAWGIPVSRITHSLHPNDYQLYEFFRGKMVELLKEAGTTEVLARPAGKGGVDAHQCGTCRLGNDPKTSVVNRYGQVHDVDNLFIVDGSLLVNGGGRNPALTIQAHGVLGFRLHRAPVEGRKLGREEGLSTTFSRRGFIFLLSALPFAPKTGLTQAVSTSGNQNQPFDDADRRVLGSLCEQIFPKDEFPGAVELGIPGFIERCLGEGHADWTAIYRAGFRSTEASSRSVYQKPFLELPFDEQTRLLERMQTGDLPKAGCASVAA